MQSACPASDPPPPLERTSSTGEIARPEDRGDVDLFTLRAAQSGDPDATERFVRHYERAVFAFLSRSLGRGPHVEDMAQEVFLRVIRALPEFEWRGTKISTWIFQIAVRLIQDQRKRPERAFVPVSDELRGQGPTPEDACERRRLLARVERLVEELPREQRMALVLTEFHGLGHAEVAEIMNTGVTTVKTRVHRARRFLRERARETSGEKS